jgi:MSHA biogenesis protein MshJ
MNPKFKPAALLAAFERLTQREKFMVALVVVGVPAYLIYLLLLAPALVKQESLEKQFSQAQAESARLMAQVTAMESESRRQDGAKKGRIEALNRDLAVQDRRFQEIEARMVAPGKMADLLQSLLAKRTGLQLISLTSLPPEPARGGAPAQPAAPVPAPSAAASTPAAALNALAGAVPGVPVKPVPGNEVLAGDELFLHGVEIQVEGSYGDLLAWLADLERMPQKMLWAGLKLNVREYPASTLVLKLQTLSREKTWLEL